MDTETERLLRAAGERAELRARSSPHPDYAAANKAFHRQKAALTRAKNSGNAAQVVAAVRKAVREWGQPPFDGMWPDDWSLWQRTLDDVLPWNQRIDIQDLAGVERRRSGSALLGRTSDRVARRAGRR